MIKYYVIYKDTKNIGKWMDNGPNPVLNKYNAAQVAEYVNKRNIGGGCRKIIDARTNEVLWYFETTPADSHHVSCYEWGVFWRGDKLNDMTQHRISMTEAEAREWVAECIEMGIHPNAFKVIRREIGPWEVVEDGNAS